MFLLSLNRRDRQPEIMDQAGLDATEHRAALDGLARVNLLSGSARILRRPLFRFARECNRPVRVLDVATGAGDVPIRLAQMARRSGLQMHFTGYDVSPVAIEHARQAAQRNGVEVRYELRNVLDEPLDEQFDAVISSLFLHHLEDDTAIRLLQSLARSARHLLLVNDLTRNRRGYLLALLGSRLLTSSRVVRVDGPLSVRAAFTPPEAARLAERAGLTGATVERHWPCRFLLSWRRA